MTFLTKKTTRLATVSILALSSLGVATQNSAYAEDGTRPLFSWGFDSQEARVDQALADANIQIKYEGVDVKPQLNVTANDGEVTARPSEAVTFQTYANYSKFIQRAEVRIFESDSSVQSQPLMTLPVDVAQTATLQANAGLPRNVIYVVRVYDAKGRFDETSPKPLSFIDDVNLSRVPDLRGTERSVYGAGYGIDRTAIRNIQVKGGGITVYGTDLSDGSQVSILGQNVLIDSDGQFAVQTILPFGEHRVKADVLDNGQRTIFERDVQLDDTEFFYVAIGDVTLGSSNAVGPANFFAESDRDFDDVTGIGRGAFYVKGRVKGDYTITAALDTGEDRIGDVFRKRKSSAQNLPILIAVFMAVS